MFKKGNSDLAVLGIVLVLGFAIVFFLGNSLEAGKPTLPEGYEDEDLSLQGKRLKGFSLGFEGLIADWYWMRSLQYIGNKFIESSDETISLDDLKPLNPRLLYPMLDNASTLDPHFLTVYSYGATVLPAIDADDAIAITKKGIDNNPDEWILYHNLGFIYWRLERFDEAAAVYGKGAELPGAAPFMKMMAARMVDEGGSRETAREMYRRLRDEATDTQTREVAELRLLQLDSFDERDFIREALTAYRDRNGRCPAGWREFSPFLAGIAPPKGLELRVDQTGAVVDPTDAPYLLTESEGKCEVILDRAKTGIPIK